MVAVQELVEDQAVDEEVEEAVHVVVGLAGDPRKVE
jgi:hypothetical protein